MAKTVDGGQWSGPDSAVSEGAHPNPAQPRVARARSIRFVIFASSKVGFLPCVDGKQGRRFGGLINALEGC